MPDKASTDAAQAAKTQAKEVEKAEKAMGKENNIPEADLLSQGDKILAVIGYFSFLCILPLVLKPDSEFHQIHGKQGLVITLAFMIIGWIVAIISSWLAVMFSLVHFTFAALGMREAFKGGTKAMPAIGDIAKKLDW